MVPKKFVHNTAYSVQPASIARHSLEVDKLVFFEKEALALIFLQIPTFRCSHIIQILKNYVFFSKKLR